MLTELREQNILRLLHEKQFVKVDEIMRENRASISTVRRDLKRLEEKGELRRIYGGAQLEQRLQDETDFEIKSKLNLSNKVSIGKVAAELVQEDEVIFLDAGTSTATMVPYLANIRGILVVTNGLTIANLLSHYDVNTYIVGGQVKNKTRALIGSEVVDRIRNFQFDRCFIGTNGIKEEKGLTTPDIQEAQIKSTVIENSKNAYALVDESKFNQVSFVKFADVNEVTLITDYQARWLKDNPSVKVVEVRE